MAGAIVNVAVAWGFVKTVDISGYSVSGREHPRWYFIEHRGFGGYSVGATTVPEKWMPEIADWDSQPVRWPVRWGTLSGPPNEDFLSGKFERVLAIADGWPFLSLRKEFINVAPNAAGQPRPGIARGATTIRKLGTGIHFSCAMHTHLAGLCDQHDLLRCDSVDDVCSSARPAAQTQNAARPVPGVCVSGWHLASLHRMRQDSNVSEHEPRLINPSS